MDFVRAICPFTWAHPYGVIYNAALARWTTPGYTTGHRYSPARTAQVQAGMIADHEVQSCAHYAVYDTATATHSSQSSVVRVEVTQTVRSDAAAANSAPDLWQFQLIITGLGWKIAADVEGG